MLGILIAQACSKAATSSYVRVLGLFGAGLGRCERKYLDFSMAQICQTIKQHYCIWPKLEQHYFCPEQPYPAPTPGYEWLLHNTI